MTDKKTKLKIVRKVYNIGTDDILMEELLTVPRLLLTLLKLNFHTIL